MATKDDVIAWGEATGLYEKGRFQEAIPIYNSIAPAIGSKILFNVGMCQGGAKRNNDAIESFSQAIKSDKYFAAAYFQRGYYQILNNAYAKAVQDYSFAFDNLRNNDLIDYTQLGLRYQLYTAEVLYNRALCKAKLNDTNGAFEDLSAAQSYKVLPEHNVIDDSLRTQRYGNPFFIPNLVYTPPEQKLKNTGKIDFLGNSKIVATTDAQDNIIGFKDAKLRRMAQERESPAPPPSRSSPPAYSASAPSSSSYSSGGGSSRPSVPTSRPFSNNNNSPPSVPASRPFASSSSSSSSSSAPSYSSGSYSSSPPPSSSSSSSSSTYSTGSVSSVSMGSTGGKIKVKCHYKDTRVVLIEKNIRFDDLVKRVSEKFDGAKIKLKYKDEDQDMVLLNDQEDLSLAFASPDVAAGKLELWCF